MDRQHGGCLCTTGGSEELAVGRKSPPLSLKASRYLSLQLFTSSKGGVLVWGDALLPGHPRCQLPRGRERADPWLFAASGGSNCLSSAPPSGIAVLLSDTSSASQGPTNTVSIPLALLFTPWGPADMFSLPSTITVIAPVRPSQVFFFFFFPL